MPAETDARKQALVESATDASNPNCAPAALGDSLTVPIAMVGLGEVITVPRNVAAAAKQLPYAPDRYFTVRSSTSIPISALNVSHARAGGIENAVELMRLAYNGNGSKRAPVSVRRIDDQYYIVVDGNSTATIAALAGWPDIPCTLLPDE